MSDFKKVETVEHPQHYNQGNIECIDAMESAFGADEVSSFCKLNAFKYLWRAGLKEDISMSEVDKEIEDLEKADEIKNKLEQEIRSLTYELESAKKRNFNVYEIEKEIKRKIRDYI